MVLERIVEELGKFELEKPMSAQTLLNYDRSIEDNAESIANDRILPCAILGKFLGSFKEPTRAI